MSRTSCIEIRSFKLLILSNSSWVNGACRYDKIHAILLLRHGSNSLDRS